MPGSAPRRCRPGVERRIEDRAGRARRRTGLAREQAVERRAGLAVAGVALEGQRQPALGLEPAAQPLGQPSSLAQLIERDRPAIRDQQTAVALLVAECLFLTAADLRGAIGTAGAHRQLRQAVERPSVPGLERHDVLECVALGLRVVAMRGEPGPDRPHFRGCEVLGRDRSQRATGLARVTGGHGPPQAGAEEGVGEQWHGPQHVAPVEPRARLIVAPVLRRQVRAGQPDTGILGRRQVGLVEHRLDFLGRDDHRVETPVLAERGDAVVGRPGPPDLAEQPAHLVEPALPEQQLGAPIGPASRPPRRSGPRSGRTSRHRAAGRASRTSSRPAASRAGPVHLEPNGTRNQAAIAASGRPSFASHVPSK